MPYMLSRVCRDDKFDIQETISLYRIEVLRCLNTYAGTNNATFMTYLYFSIKRIVYDYFVRRKPIVAKCESKDISAYGDLIETI